MKKWIAYIFIAIFSLQVIPIKEIGKILYKGQITEEEVHGYSGPAKGDDNSKLKKEGDPLLHQNVNFQDQARAAFLTHKIITAIHRSEHIPDFHVADIITPPPNC
ncbi:MAG TPA: hypothetical protein PL009_03070 [Flavipsychrobacter sp.]|nr:hypothetical protein [Flavipsychrobacter sp.]